MKTTHTPEPWMFSEQDGHFVVEHSHQPTISDSGDAMVARVNNPQDARIITAAPEMLEACYSILNVEGLASAAERSVPAFKGVDVKYHFDKIRTAIAKATGNNQLEGKGDL